MKTAITTLILTIFIPLARAKIRRLHARNPYGRLQRMMYFGASKAGKNEGFVGS